MASPSEIGNIDYGVLTDLLGSRMGALEDARGDVTGAADALYIPQRRLVKAEEALAQRRLELAEGLIELDLPGRAIRFDEGRSRGSLDRSLLTKQFFVNRETSCDLAGASGIVLGAEVNTVLGVPVAEDDQIVLQVYLPSEFPQNHVVVANEARYNIAAAAQPAEG